MLPAFKIWTALGLLVVGAKAFYGPVVHNPHYPFYNTASSRTTTCTPEQTILSPTSTHCYSTEQTTLSPTSTPCSTTESITASTTTNCVSPPENITISIPTVSTISPSTIITITYVPTTIETSIPTVFTTSYTTLTTTTIVPTTITPPPPPPNPCPTYCSISAGTVNLFYWPTNEPYTYPSTYVDTHLDYTFTSPSVYMVVNTIFGYNTAGRAGPSGTSVVFPLDLDQVSTMDPDGSVTRQLTLSDLGTDCPQTEAASVIATAAPDGRCDPILVAPDRVKSWALPCNACGGFGLFDPPYAVPPLQGGLVPGPTTTSMAQPEPQTTTSEIPATESTTAESTTTSAVTQTTPDVAPIPTLTPLSSTTSVAASSPSLGSDPNPTTTNPATTPAMAASAIKVTGGRACLILSFFISVYLL